MSRKQDIPSNSEIEAVIQAATSGVTITGQPLKDTRTQLFVGNLPYRVRWQDLKDLFRSHLPSSTPPKAASPPIGLPGSPSQVETASQQQQQQPASTTNPILRADVSLGPDNRSRGFGTVLMSNKEDAYRAVERLNGYCWQGRVLEVRVDRVIGTSGSPPPPSQSSAGTGFQTTPSLGFNVVGGQDEYYGRSTFSGTGYVSPDNLRNLGKSLIVANLPPSVQWQELKDLFRSAGTIVRADIAPAPQLPNAMSFSPFTLRESEPSSLRTSQALWGTVTYASTLDRERAISVFDGWEWRGHKLVIRPLEAVMKDHRVAPLLLASAPSPPSSSRSTTSLLDPGSTGVLHGVGMGAFGHLEPAVSNSAGIANADVLLSVLRTNAPTHAGYSSARSQSPKRPSTSGFPGFSSLHSSSQPHHTPSAFTTGSLTSSPRPGAFFGHNVDLPDHPSSNLGNDLGKSHIDKAAAELFTGPTTSTGQIVGQSRSAAAPSFLTALPQSVPVLKPQPRLPPRKLQTGSEIALNVDGSSRVRSRLGFASSIEASRPWDDKGKERHMDSESLMHEGASGLMSTSSATRQASLNRVKSVPSLDIPETTFPPRQPIRPPRFSEARSPGRANHPHPGPISLPPPAPFFHQASSQALSLATPPLPSPYGYPQTPPSYPPHHPPMVNFTHPSVGLGLPPLTPSMPSFSFMPQPAAGTPTFHPQYMSPGLMGTPNPNVSGIMSMSGAFSTSSEHPVLGGTTPVGSRGGYFEQPVEYFPPMPPPPSSAKHETPSQNTLQHSDSPLGFDQGSKDSSRRPSTSTSESDLGLHNIGPESSTATTSDEAEISKETSALTGKIKEMTLRQPGLKPDSPQSESFTRSKSMDANLLQLSDSGSPGSTLKEQPLLPAVPAQIPQNVLTSSESTTVAPISKPKGRSKPHPTFQASEFASIVSGFQGIVPTHVQGDDKSSEGGTGLTPGHGRRASWTPGTERSSYI